MKIKGHINRLLSHDVDESPPEAARDSQLRLPTLDERVSLYLSAVYGKHDFGNEAYSDARNRILNAMAADIAAKSEINLPEKPKILDFLQDANPNETRWQRDLLDYQHRYAASVRA